MSTKKLLSIVIPSNNLASFLEQALDSIILDKSFNNLIEICISDNRISDETNQLYKKKYSSLEFITYKRSLETPSLDENAFEVSKLATGKYIWFFGDDDLLISGALNKIVIFLRKTKPSIVILNSKSFYSKGQIQEYRVPLKNNVFFDYKDNDKFLSTVGGYITYIPSILINNQVLFIKKILFKLTINLKDQIVLNRFSPF